MGLQLVELYVEDHTKSGSLVPARYGSVGVCCHMCGCSIELTLLAFVPVNGWHSSWKKMRRCPLCVLWCCPSSECRRTVLKAVVGFESLMGC
jgi:hypothetical protein